jgi:oxygen-independent coproporphyrinogen-3 oxidase
VAAFGLARDVFERVSLDLIYARQGQTPEAWGAELREALRLAAGTCRSTSSPSRRDGLRRPLRGRESCADLPDEDRRRTCGTDADPDGAAGLPAYEVSKPCSAGRGQPAQPRLLAGRRLGGRGTGGAWAADPGRRADRDRDGAAPGQLASAGGAGRVGASPRRAAHAREAARSG